MVILDHDPDHVDTLRKFDMKVFYGCLLYTSVFCMVWGFISSTKIFHANAYQKLLNVQEGNFTEDVKEIHFDQIPMLDKESAMKLGDRKMGELVDMVSQFEVAADYSQINYQGRPVRVTPLEYGDLIKWFNNVGQGLPAYIMIDMVTQEVTVHRLEQGRCV